uniref:Putative secreted protein n=1 Tax=Xenopsylla cheopis TaxID=163159 RepID=A0A6M2E0A7_XENCH
MKRLVLVIFNLWLLVVVTADKVSSCFECDDCNEVPGNPDNCAKIDKCFIRLHEGKVYRGCTNNATDCKINEICETCKSNLCNGGELTFPKCIADDNTEQECKGPCYYYQKGTENKKGCLANLTQEDPIAIECQQPNSLYCKTCTTNSCNSQKPLQCVQCESNDDKCTTSNQNELAAMVAMCNFGKDRCFVSQIDGNKNRRGCTNKALCDEAQREQSCCEGNGCNTGKQPLNRNECFKDKNKTETKVCLQIRDDCYSNFEEGKHSRGCVSDEGNTCTANTDTCIVCHGNKCNKHITCKTCNEVLATNCSSEKCESGACISHIKDGKMDHRCALKDEKCGQEEDCEICKTSDCNAKFVPKTWLQCHQCEGKDCEKQRIPSQATYCSKYVKDDACYTQVNGQTVSRGCVSDLENHNCQENVTLDILRDAENRSVCVQCKDSACNSKALKPQPLLCYQCDDKVVGCGPNLNKTLIQATKCGKSMPDGSMERCFSYKHEIKRGCLADLSDDIKCTKEDSCHICEVDGCNDQPGGQGINKPLSILYTISILITIFKFY